MMEQRTRQIRGCSGCLYVSYVSAIARTGGCYIAWGLFKSIASRYKPWISVISFLPQLTEKSEFIYQNVL